MSTRLAADVPGGDAAREAVTIAVPCRSDEPALGATLASLDRAAARLVARGHPARLVVCVNGPQGGIAQADAEQLERRSVGLSLELLLELEADKARAWNRLRASCTTPLIVCCDADVELAPDALVALVEALEANPEVLLASARQIPLLAGQGWVARAAALPYRFEFGVVGGRLYAMRSAALERMPERLLLEDGWLSARLGRSRLLTVERAEVYFHPPCTLADYLRERLRTEAGKVQIRAWRAANPSPPGAIARYPWRAMARELAPRDWPLVALNVAVRGVARVVAELAARRGRELGWATVTTSKPARAAGGRFRE